MINQDELITDIFTSFWRSNVLSKKEAEDHAALAVVVMKSTLKEHGYDIIRSNS